MAFGSCVLLILFQLHLEHRSRRFPMEAGGETEDQLLSTARCFAINEEADLTRLIGLQEIEQLGRAELIQATLDARVR